MKSRWKNAFRVRIQKNLVRIKRMPLIRPMWNGAVHPVGVIHRVRQMRFR